MINVISDIAGRFDELMLLVDKMPTGELISVGDMVDRGKQSKQVLDYFMNTPNTRAILGNHEHMMLDYMKKTGFYPYNTWIVNGGKKTIKSFHGYKGVTSEYINWLTKLPKYIIIDDILISHSFIHPYYTLEQACDFGNNIYAKDETTIIWNRNVPIRRKEYKLQVVGHNSNFGLKKFEDKDGLVGICLDDSANNKLTGLCLETMQIYQVDYIK